MPIRPEYRHFYTGPAWRETRARILQRANDCCERCRVPNHTTVLRASGWWTPDSIEAVVFKHGGRMNGSAIIQLPWHHSKLKEIHTACFLAGSCRWVHIVLTVAHLNHTPGDDRDENLLDLCQWCHLQNDAMVHVRNAHLTRSRRKDLQRPILTAIDAEVRAS